jgi:hypothetical protein
MTNASNIGTVLGTNFITSELYRGLGLGFIGTQIFLLLNCIGA